MKFCRISMAVFGNTWYLKYSQGQYHGIPKEVMITLTKDPKIQSLPPVKPKKYWELIIIFEKSHN